MTTTNRSSDPPVGRLDAADYFAYAVRVEPVRPELGPTEGG